MARTAAVSSSLFIDTDLLGANLDFSERNKQKTTLFTSTMWRYEHAPYANGDALAKH